MNKTNGISIITNSFFNTDNVDRTEILPSEARSIFDFEIVKEPSCRPNGDIIPKHFHLVARSDENDFGNVVGNAVGEEFEPTQAGEVLDFFIDELLPACPDLKIETVATLNGGATSFVNMVFGDSWTVPGDTSPSNTRLLYVNPLTNGSIKLLSHTVRVICMNTLKMAQNTGTGFHISHTRNAGFYVNAALEAIKGQVVQAQDIKNLSFALANKDITSKNIEEILDAVYPVKKNSKGEDAGRYFNLRKEVIRRFETDETFKTKSAWNFLNAMTYGVEHPNLTALRTGDKVAFDNMYGARANLKSRMLEVTANTMGIALPMAA